MVESTVSFIQPGCQITQNTIILKYTTCQKYSYIRKTYYQSNKKIKITHTVYNGLKGNTSPLTVSQGEYEYLATQSPVEGKSADLRATESGNVVVWVPDAHLKSAREFGEIRFATMLKDPVFQFGVFYALLYQCAFGFGEYHIAKAACANDVYLSLFSSACVH